MVPGGQGELITTQNGLSKLIQQLRSAGSFAYDSEFIGEMTYLPKLCLIQVASARHIALIDPLASIDLTPFWELICDPDVEKIVHAGQQDIEPVIRHLGRKPTNLFDTQIAGGFIGMGYPIALSKLVQELVGARLGKGLTFSHWDQRPLSAMQLRYAADDVRYLPALRAEMGRRLDAAGHAAWAKEECAELCDVSGYGFNPDSQYLRVRGATSLAPRGLAVLRELTIWRDAAARAHDVPPRTLLKDEILIDLSRSPVKSIEKLAQVRGLPRPIEHAHGSEIVEATLRGLETPQEQLPVSRVVEPGPRERFRADALWATAQCLCIAQSIDPGLVASRQEIGEFYQQAVQGDPIEESGILKGWRRQALGEPLLRLMRENGSVHLKWSDGSLCFAMRE